MQYQRRSGRYRRLPVISVNEKDADEMRLEFPRPPGIHMHYLLISHKWEGLSDFAVSAGRETVHSICWQDVARAEEIWIL